MLTGFRIPSGQTSSGLISLPVPVSCRTYTDELPSSIADERFVYSLIEKTCGLLNTNKRVIKSCYSSVGGTSFSRRSFQLPKETKQPKLRRTATAITPNYPLKFRNRRAERLPRVTTGAKRGSLTSRNCRGSHPLHPRRISRYIAWKQLEATLFFFSPRSL